MQGLGFSMCVRACMCVCVRVTIWMTRSFYHFFIFKKFKPQKKFFSKSTFIKGKLLFFSLLPPVSSHFALWEKTRLLGWGKETDGVGGTEAGNWKSHPGLRRPVCWRAEGCGCSQPRSALLRWSTWSCRLCSALRGSWDSVSSDIPKCINHYRKGSDNWPTDRNYEAKYFNFPQENNLKVKGNPNRNSRSSVEKYIKREGGVKGGNTAPESLWGQWNPHRWVLAPPAGSPPA